MMMVVAAAAAVVALLQTTWLSGLRIFGAQPDIVLLLLVWGAHRVGTQRGQIWSFATGIVEDIISLSPLGFHAVMRLVPSSVIGLTSGAVRPDGILSTMLMVTVALLIRTITTIGLLLLASRAGQIQFLFTVTTAIEAGITIALGPPLFKLIGIIAHRFSHERRYR